MRTYIIGYIFKMDEPIFKSLYETYFFLTIFGKCCLEISEYPFLSLL